MISQLHIQPIQSWLPDSTGPIIISGPCSAESEQQVFETASELAKIGKVVLFRAGIWKPRTRPNAFEGVGEEALEWVVNAGKYNQLKTCVEVATPAHVDQALKAGVDVLWIGARTSTNPFSVQSIADSLKGVDIPVLVKNPINPDLDLWVGALERINGAGISKIGAIHRGFSTYHEQYRNAPIWEIPLKLKTLFPDLPLINDPSHISGSRSHLAEVAQKAMDLDMDGLMVESHISPDKALSDAKQQLTPADFGKMLDNLRFRTATSTSPSYQVNLEELRSKIDRIDNELLELLANRIDLTKNIGEFKKENGVTIFQVDRWREIMETRPPFGISKGLSAEFVDHFLQLLHDESIKIQTKILNSSEEM
jgi:chorismate mutase